MIYNSQEWQDNLKKMERRLEYIKQLPNENPGVYLHLGCGSSILKGFINIDKYAKNDKVLKLDMEDLEAFSEVNAIYSSHSLEHLPYRRAKLSIYRWYNVLRKGGKVFLAIPDLEEIMNILLKPDITGELRDWFMYTLFGYQVSTDHDTRIKSLTLPVDAGQFHTCGFTKATISGELKLAGFKIKEIYNYDGYMTPSIWVEAVKD